MGTRLALRAQAPGTSPRDRSSIPSTQAVNDAREQQTRPRTRAWCISPDQSNHHEKHGPMSITTSRVPRAQPPSSRRTKSGDLVVHWRSTRFKPLNSGTWRMSTGSFAEATVAGTARSSMQLATLVHTSRRPQFVKSRQQSRERLPQAKMTFM